MNKNIVYTAIALAMAVSYNVNAAEKVTSVPVATEEVTTAPADAEKQAFPLNSFDFSTFRGIYLGVGGGMNFGRTTASTTINGAQHPYYAAVEGIDNKLGLHRLMGSIVMGIGKTFKDKHYLSFEAMIDLAQATSYYGKANDGGQYSNSHNTYTEIKTRNNGVVPSLAVRYGLVVNPSLMIYAKLGGCYNKATAEWEASDTANLGNYAKIKLSKITPIAGIGVEKAFGKFVSRFDVEYKFHRTKNVARPNTNYNVISSKVKDDGGFNIRLMLCYNINFNK